MSKIKVDGQWNTPAPHIKENGVWKPITNAWIKDDGTWKIYHSINLLVEYIVVGGGGGGGTNVSGYDPGGGGGGAGGFRASAGVAQTSGGNSTPESPLILDLLTPYTVTVGLGGPRGSSSAGSDGGFSQFANVISAGGGGGARENASGRSGGSGGGAGGGATASNGGSGTTGQGRDGGDHNPPSGNQGSGGGGASGEPPNLSSTGGVGLESDITGTNVFYAGGGGAYFGSGGRGGGGNGGVNTAGLPGTDGLGGGGGGSGNVAQTGGGQKVGGRGGHGVVIFRIPSIFTASFSGTLSTALDISSAPGFKIYKVISGTGTVTFNYA